MSTLLLLTVAAALGALGALSAAPFRARRDERRAELWRRVAEHAGLNVTAADPAGVRATIGALTVTIRATVARDLERMRVPGDAVVTFDWPVFPGVSVAARSWSGTHGLSSGESAVLGTTIHDEAFDRAFAVEGPETTLRALLDPDTRSGLNDLLEVLRLERPALSLGSLRHFSTYAEAPPGPADLVARLGQNALHERIARVREADVRCLATTFPNDEVTLRVARALLKDPDEWVRLEAASALPVEGRSVLLDLAQGDWPQQGCGLMALQRLVGSLSRAEIRSGLVRSLGAGRWTVAGAWTRLLDTANDPEDCRAITAALAAWRNRLSWRWAMLDGETERLDGEVARIQHWSRRTLAVVESVLTETPDRTDERARTLTAKRNELLERHGVPRAVALVTLLQQAPRGPDRDAALLEALKGPFHVRTAAAEILVRDPVCLSSLWDWAELAPVLASALARLEPADVPAGLVGFEPAEEALAAALAHASVHVVRAAASSLGRIGTVHAIPPLRECGEKYQGDRETEGAVRQAIAEIQSRLPGASPGQLSIAGAEAGQVSLVGEDQRGQVSLEADEEVRHP